MRMDYDGHNSLVNYARLLGTHAQINRFAGWDILKGVKVSRIVGLYGKSDGNWLWHIVEGIVGNVDRNLCRTFASAVFILDLHYRMSDDRSEEAFHACNLDFLHNGIKCVCLAHGWWSPKRYSMSRLVKSMYAKIDEDGYGFWQNKGAGTV